MIKLIISLLFLISTLSDTCPPHYWEVNSSFSVPVDDLKYVAEKGINLSNIDTSKGISPNKITYTISAINTTVTYDNSSQYSM